MPTLRLPTPDGQVNTIYSDSVLYTDRSRIQTREECPQRRYLQYHAQREDQLPDSTLGIQRVGRSVPLVTGQAVHTGLAYLAIWHMETNGTQGQPLGQFPSDIIQSAIQAGLSDYHQMVEDRGFGRGYSQSDGTVNWIIQEQTALTQALIYVGARRVLEPLFNSGHWILSAEQERKTLLHPGQENREDLDPVSFPLVFLSRADLEVYDPDENLLYVINFKTAKEYTDWQAGQLQIGLQTIGEAVALDAWHKSGLDLSLQQVPPNAGIAGVQYIYFIKGRQQYDRNRGHDVTYNHLIRAWTNVDPLTGNQNYSWLYFYPNSKRQVLSKGSGFWTFESFPGGTLGWIDFLLQGKALPTKDPDNMETMPDPLEELVRLPGMSFLHPQRKERWQQQTIRDEILWHQNLQNPDYRPSMHMHQCGRGKWKCEMFPICHENLTIDNELYMPREANHPEAEPET